MLTCSYVGSGVAGFTSPLLTPNPKTFGRGTTPGLAEARFFLLGRLAAFRLSTKHTIMGPLNLVLRALVRLSNWGYFKRVHNRCLRTAIHA